MSPGSQGSSGDRVIARGWTRFGVTQVAWNAAARLTWNIHVLPAARLWSPLAIDRGAAGGRETAQTTGKTSTPEKQTDWHFLRENKQWQVIRVTRCLPVFTPTSVDFFWKVGQRCSFCVRVAEVNSCSDWFGAVCYGLSSHWPPFISLFLTPLYLLCNKFYPDTSHFLSFFLSTQWFFNSLAFLTLA